MLQRDHEAEVRSRADLPHISRRSRADLYRSPRISLPLPAPPPQVRIATALRAAGITSALGAGFGRDPVFPILKVRDAAEM